MDSKGAAAWGMAIAAMLIWGPDAWAFISSWLEAKLNRQYEAGLASVIYLAIQAAFYVAGAAILQHFFWVCLTMFVTGIATLTYRLPGFAG